MLVPLNAKMYLDLQFLRKCFGGYIEVNIFVAVLGFTMNFEGDRRFDPEIADRLLRVGWRKRNPGANLAAVSRYMGKPRSVRELKSTDCRTRIASNARRLLGPRGIGGEALAIILQRSILASTGRPSSARISASYNFGSTTPTCFCTTWPCLSNRKAVGRPRIPPNLACNSGEAIATG